MFFAGFVMPCLFYMNLNQCYFIILPKTFCTYFAAMFLQGTRSRRPLKHLRVESPPINYHCTSFTNHKSCDNENKKFSNSQVTSPNQRVTWF